MVPPPPPPPPPPPQGAVQPPQRFSAQFAPHATYRSTRDCQQGMYAHHEAIKLTELNAEPDEIENKICIGLLLSRKMGFDTSSQVRIKAKGNARAGSYFKQMRQSDSSVSYKCIYHFADMSSNGNVFAMIDRTASDQRVHWKYDLTPRVGRLYAFDEPDPNYTYLSEEVPLIDIDGPVIPLESTPHTYVPVSKAEGGVSKFFVFNNATIRIRKMKIVRTSCTGIQCDRRIQNDTCGCNSLDRSGGKSFTLKMHVVVTDPVSKEDVRLYDWCSLAMLNLLTTGGIAPHAELDDKHQLYRTSMQAAVDHVNQHGGWTVVGWHRLGLRTDEQGDLVVSPESTMHIEVVRPNTVTKQDLSDEDLLFDIAGLYSV